MNFKIHTQIGAFLVFALLFLGGELLGLKGVAQERRGRDRSEDRPKRDDQRASRSEGDKAKDGQKSGADQKAEIDATIRASAERFMKTKDKDGDGKISVATEATAMFRDADKNGNGFLEVGEVEAKMRAATSDPEASLAPVKPSEEAKEVESDSPPPDKNAPPPQPKSYRFKTARERMEKDIKDLPNWFLEKDRDGDGQISMSEFAALWTEDLASQFTSFDANGDGVITLAECLKKARAKPSRKK